MWAYPFWYRTLSKIFLNLISAIPYLLTLIISLFFPRLAKSIGSSNRDVTKTPQEPAFYEKILQIPQTYQKRNPITDFIIKRRFLLLGFSSFLLLTRASHSKTMYILDARVKIIRGASVKELTKNFTIYQVNL